MILQSVNLPVGAGRHCLFVPSSLFRTSPERLLTSGKHIVAAHSQDMEGFSLALRDTVRFGNVCQYTPRHQRLDTGIPHTPLLNAASPCWQTTGAHGTVGAARRAASSIVHAVGATAGHVGSTGLTGINDVVKASVKSASRASSLARRVVHRGGQRGECWSWPALTS